jgi:cytochrome bd-type quinol oxidase subunit 2
MANTVPASTKYDAYNEASPANQDIAAAKFNYANMKAELQIESERWKTKRRMAWFSLIAMIAATGAMFFFVSPTRMAALDSVISWFYMANTTIIGAYIGTSTWEHVSKLRPTKPSISDSANIASTPFDALNQDQK